MTSLSVDLINPLPAIANPHHPSLYDCHDPLTSSPKDILRTLRATQEMNAVRASARLPRQSIQHLTRRKFHTPTLNTGGLRLSQAHSNLRNIRVRPWPFGAYTIHNGVAVRNASFARALPNLALKLTRIPAMVGVAGIGGLAYLQYQANLAGTYAKEQFGKGWDLASGAAGNLYSALGGAAEQTKTGWERTKEHVELPAWMQQIFEGQQGGSSSGGGGPGGDPPPRQAKAAGATMAATGAAFGYSQSPEDDERGSEGDCAGRSDDAFDEEND